MIDVHRYTRGQHVHINLKSICTNAEDPAWTPEAIIQEWVKLS